MKIIFIVKSFAMKAGVERIMSDKMNYLAEKGHKITLITYEQGDHPFSFSLHPSIKHQDLDTRLFTLKKFQIARRIIEIVKLKKVFKKRLQKVVDTIHPDIINVTTYSLNLADCILDIKTNAKRTIESHISYDSILKENDFRQNPLLRLLAKLYDHNTLKKVKQFDAFFALTQGDANLWKQHTQKIHIIPNAVTLYPETIKSHKDPYHRIICAGRLDPQKGFDLLIKAFALLSNNYPKWHIDIFGNGAHEQNLRDLITEKKLDNQIFIHPASDHIFEEFQTSDFFVFSSRYEGWGLVLVEAMACGIPAVSFRCNYGPEDIITHKKDGLLVKNGDIHDMAEKIRWMIEHPIERFQMGLAARESSKRFKKDVIVEQWLQILSSLMVN